MRGVFEEFAEGKPVTPKFTRIPYAEALAKYGTDKPDLRNPIVMQDVSEIFRGSGFKIFARILETSAKGAVWAIPAPTGGSRAFCDRMNSWAQGEGQPGLGYIFFALDNGRKAAHAARLEGRRCRVLRRRRTCKLCEICRPCAH
jgi:aspartyl-tRNA synthetase